ELGGFSGGGISERGWDPVDDGGDQDDDGGDEDDEDDDGEGGGSVFRSAEFSGFNCGLPTPPCPARQRYLYDIYGGVLPSQRPRPGVAGPRRLPPLAEESRRRHEGIDPL